jgi:hypothetical protein
MVLVLFTIIAAVMVYIIILANNRRQADAKQTNDIVLDPEEESRVMAEKIQVMIQAGIVGDEATVKAINDGTYDGPWPVKRADSGYLSLYDTLRILKIAGINHRQNIGQYTGRTECALVPEPTNQFDPNAIKIVAEDSHHLGYIEAHQTDFVRSLALNSFPYRCTCIIDEHEDEFDGHKFYTGFVYIKQNMEIKRE